MGALWAAGDGEEYLVRPWSGVSVDVVPFGFDVPITRNIEMDITKNQVNMRVSEKLAAIDRIARELQSRYSYSEIDTYLSEFEIAPPKEIHVNSKWVYSKAALQGVDLVTLAKIVDDLELGSITSVTAPYMPPAIWKDTKQFRLFISHIAKHKDKATRLKTSLKPYAISGFVAHEDINPTLEWQREIERALHCMDAFVAIHTPGFSASFWTQQEIGFAVGLGTKIISLKMGEDPTGFISKHQALPRQKRTAEEIAKEIDNILTTDDRTAGKISEAKRVMSVISDPHNLPY
jgi:hypothetical protein